MFSFARFTASRPMLQRLAALPLLLLSATLFIPFTARAQSTSFAANTLIIPMDTTYQDSGMFVAYGLVDDLLRGGVQVRWVIASPKAYGGTDFTLGAGVDVRTSAALSSVNYRGGPFVVDSSAFATALPIVQRWQAANGALAVHRATATFIAPVSRLLKIAPDLAVFADGNEDIAFGYLNAAQIPQSFLAGVKRVGPAITVGGTISTAPVVTAAPAGNSTVNGTTVEANGTVINVFVNGLYAGSATVTATPNWSLGPVAILPGINVTATATAPGEGTSSLSGNRASGALPAGGTSAAPVIFQPIRHGDMRVYGTSTEANTTTIKVFKNGSLVATGAVTAGKWSIPVPTAAAGGDTYTATATAPAKTESQLATFAVVVPVAAVTTGNVIAGSRRPAGTLSLADGTPVRVYRNRGGTVTLLESPAVSNLAWQTANNYALLSGDLIWAEVDTFPWPGARDNGALYSCPGRYCCPECNGETALIGPSTVINNDGILFSPEGAPRFCQVMSMHYGAPGTPAVVAEVRQFLNFRTHAFMECQAVNAFENVAGVGRYLTTNGLVAGAVPAPYFTFNNDSPFAQADGAYTNPGGSERSYSLAGGSSYYASNTVMLSSSATQNSGVNDILMTGYLDNNTAYGIVTYLGAHQYTTALPLSANPNSQGTRYFLNSMYEAPCVSSATPTLSMVLSGPVVTSGASAVYTISYTTTGAGLLNNAVISLPFPAGMGFVSATNGGVLNGSTVSWNLGNIPAGTGGTLQVTLSFSADGSYSLTSSGTYQAGASTLTMASNTITTLRDSGPPAAPAITAPANGSSTTSTTPTLSGTAEAGSTVTLTITGPGGPYIVTTTADGSGNYSVSAPVLPQGAYSVSATATDAAGNISPASGANSFNVVFTAPVLTGPINAGAGSISGTSSAPNGTTITVYSNGIPIGTTTVTGGSWTLSGVTGLAGGESITSTTGTGAATSAPSAAIIVTPAAPAISGPVVTGGPVTVGGTSGAPNGSTVTVLVNGTPVVCTPGATVTGGVWSCGGLTLAPGDVVTATVTTNGQTSSGSGSQTVHFSAPALTGPINAGASSISGTSNAADGTTITVYSNGTPIGTTTVSGGVWTLSGVTGLAGGESITASAGTGASISANSSPIIVIPSAPAISGPIVTGGPVTVSGASGALDGSTVTVLVNGTPVVCTPGATVSGGVWSCGGLTLNPGDVVTATVTANGQTSSGSGSQTVHFAAPALTGPINAGASSISGTSNAADGTTITVYSNGTPIGTTTVTGGVWTLSGVTGLAGGESITASAGTGAAISANSSPIIVIPAAPSITGPVVTGGPVTVSGTSGAPNGSTVTVLVNGTPVVCTPVATVSGGVWSCGGLTLAPGDVVTATVTANGQTSSGSGSQTVQYAAPGLTGPIVAGSTSISGTSSAADGTPITVYSNGTPITCTPAAVVSGGTWTCGGVSGLAAGQVITATAGSGAAQSAASGSQTVIHQTPAISSPIYPTDSSISGTSGSPDGTTITVYNNGTPIGTTTVTGGTWTLSGVSGLAGGNSITAAAGTGATTSALSTPVTVAPLPGLLRNATQGTLTPTAATFPRAPGDPSLGTGDRVVFLFASAASYPQESTDYTDQTAPIVFYQLEANSGNTLTIAKDDLNGKLVISY